MTEVYATPATASRTTADAFSRSSYGSSAAHLALSVRQVEKLYGSKDAVTKALAGVSFDVESGEFVAIMGPSGSGKTTLLNCIATIDRATSGRIVIGGRDITGMNKRQLARFRRDDLGFIFQDSNLLDTMTGFENIALALTIKRTPSSQVGAKVEHMANVLGIRDVLAKYPYQMSGGQKQRVAAARAMVGGPKLIVADEPTGALDSRSAAVMLETLDLLNTQMDATILMVTHDAYAASFTGRVLFIKDGELFNEIRRGDASREEFFSRIMEVVAFLGGEARHGA